MCTAAPWFGQWLCAEAEGQLGRQSEGQLAAVGPSICSAAHCVTVHYPGCSLAAPTCPALACRSVSAMATAASLSFGGAALLGFATLVSLLKVRSLEKKEAQLTGAV